MLNFYKKDKLISQFIDLNLWSWPIQSLNKSLTLCSESFSLSITIFADFMGESVSKSGGSSQSKLGIECIPLLKLVSTFEVLKSLLLLILVCFVVILGTLLMEKFFIKLTLAFFARFLDALKLFLTWSIFSSDIIIWLIVVAWKRLMVSINWYVRYAQKISELII